MDGYGPRDGRRPGSYKGAIDDADQELVSAPPFGDPACFLHVDALPVRDTLDAEVDAIRAAAGLRPVSAATFRLRSAKEHRAVADEFARRRGEGRNARNDELCRGVQAAMDTGVPGACAYCGCSFSVVAVVELMDLGKVCGRCGRGLRAHQPVPVVRVPAENEEERFKGWTPW